MATPKILIVEDSKTFSEYLSHVIKSENYNFDIAENGKKCFEYLESNSYNLILLDMELPDYSGIEILKFVRKKYNQIELPVMFISATTDEQKIINALEIGANDFISKPFTEIKLKIKVKNMLQLQQTNAKLKHISQQRNDIFEFSPIASIVIDQTGVIQEINKAAYEVFQVEPDAIINILNGEIFCCNNAIHNKGMCGKMEICSDCTIRSSFNESIQTNTNIIKREGIFNVFVNNQIEQRVIVVSSIILNTNELTYTLLTIEDITERKKAEQIINQKNNELKNLNADKDRFMSILAHDLRNPFNALLGLTDLLARNVSRYNTEKIERYATQINKSAQNTFNLLDDLLMWSRVQSGKIPFEPQEFNLAEICSVVVENLKLNADNKNILINQSIAEEINIFADINMIKTVLRNLISNAIKFTNENGQINISVENGHENILISVSDNGIGIEQNTLNNLFDISQMQTTHGTAEEEGTGLGLLLCKEFVEKHNGKIWVESKIGKGSKFNFTLSQKYDSFTLNNNARLNETN